MLTSTILAMASLLFAPTMFPMEVQALPTPLIEDVVQDPTIPQIIIQFSLPEPLLEQEDLPRHRRPAFFLPDGTVFAPDGQSQDSSSDEVLYEDNMVFIGDDMRNDHFAFDLSQSAISPYHSFLRALHSILSSLTNAIYNVSSFLLSLFGYQNDPLALDVPRGGGALYEGLQPMTLEEEFGDDASYPVFPEIVVEGKEGQRLKKAALRKAEAWAKFEKIIEAFTNSPPSTSSSPSRPRTNQDSSSQKSSFHRGIKDAVRQA